MKIKKSDIVNAWNEIEEVATDLRELPISSIINLLPTIQNRLNKALKLLDKYVSIEDLIKEKII